MSDKTKKSIAGVILAASIIVGAITGGGFENLKIGGKSHWLTKNQYKNLKNELVEKYMLYGEFTIDEYQLFIAVMDKEVKKEKKKFKNIEKVDQDNIVSKIINKVIQINEQ